MTIYLIRHGKTEANEKRLYCGSTDLPLSEAGREELRNLSYNIKNIMFSASVKGGISLSAMCKNII